MGRTTRAAGGTAVGTAIGVGVGVGVGVAFVGLASWTGGEEPTPETGPLPVITPETRWDSVPSAAVSGPLTMRDGCLLLDSDVVFWQHGTRWDEGAEAVVLGDGTTVGLGEVFTGGGGHYDLRGDDSGPLDVRAWLGDEAGRWVESCSTTTGTTRIVFAYADGEA